MSGPTAGLVVIGSGPAGISAALSYREAGGDGPVTVFGADVDPPYERPPLSKEFLSGALDDPISLLHRESVYQEQRIELRLGQPVRRLDARERRVVTDAGSTEFAHCVIATGATPRRPPVPGADGPCVHTLRSARDAVALAGAADPGAHALVVGSGFIGCEAASSLAHRGLRVSLLTQETSPQQGRLGDWVGSRLAEWLVADGVELITDRRLTRVDPEDGGVVVHTNTGATIRAELVLLATGVIPDVELALAAGIGCERGRIRVGSDMRTNVDGVFAAGDVTWAFNRRLGRPVVVEHWGDALTMGEIAGANAAGGSADWDQVPGFWSTIGGRTLKYAAWGEDYDDVQISSDGEAYTVWYGRDGRTVGVLTHDRDADYEWGTGLVATGGPLPR